MNSSRLDPLTGQVMVSRCDRWPIYQRLQELEIPCQYNSGGILQVEIHSPLVLFQLRSVVQQFTAPQAELVDWLHRCLACSDR